MTWVHPPHNLQMRKVSCPRSHSRKGVEVHWKLGLTPAENGAPGGSGGWKVIIPCGTRGRLTPKDQTDCSPASQRGHLSCGRKNEKLVEQLIPAGTAGHPVSLQFPPSRLPPATPRLDFPASQRSKKEVGERRSSPLQKAYFFVFLRRIGLQLAREHPKRFLWIYSCEDPSQGVRNLLQGPQFRGMCLCICMCVSRGGCVRAHMCVYLFTCVSLYVFVCD